MAKIIAAMTGDPYTALQPALTRLDTLLARAVDATAVVYGETADRFRGLYIPPEEAVRLLHAEPVRWPLLADTAGAPGPAWSRLESLYDLDGFDLDVLLLALAPWLDRRYERLYAYLQDHVAYTAPTVAFALNLLAPQHNRLHWRQRFLPDSPLLRHGLISLVADANARQPSLLSHFIRLDAQVAGWLLGDPTPDARLDLFCTRLEGDVAVPPAVWVAALERAWTDGAPLRLCLLGRSGAGKRDLAAAAARVLDTSLWWIDVRGIPDDDFKPVVQAALRHARCHGTLPYITGLEAIAERPAQNQKWRAIVQADGRALLVGAEQSGAWEEGAEMIEVPVTAPNFATRRRVWQQVLGEAQTCANLDALANRFRLAPHQIRAIAARAAWLDGPLESRLFALARIYSAADLGGLAQKINALYRWDDLVLPADSLAQLRELCARVGRRHTVLEEWGFGARLSVGTGVNALFAGPTGTGKTMAAEVIANELGLDLYKIDLSGIVSKYIGETEKNLNRIFTAAQGSSAILFFDEADSLFGKRSEVRDSHDRYANIEISYLLQKMEEYDGISILTTNLRHNLDDAFVRRLAFTVHFPFPDAPSREAIWRGIWPQGVPLATDLDFAALGQAHKLSGGNIKNVALAAAFLAAEDGGVVSLAHVQHAIQREYQKLGKTLALNGAENG